MAWCQGQLDLCDEPTRCSSWHPHAYLKIRQTGHGAVSMLAGKSDAKGASGCSGKSTHHPQKISNSVCCPAPAEGSVEQGRAQRGNLPPAIGFSFIKVAQKHAQQGSGGGARSQSAISHGQARRAILAILDHLILVAARGVNEDVACPLPRVMCCALRHHQVTTEHWGAAGPAAAVRGRRCWHQASARVQQYSKYAQSTAIFPPNQRTCDSQVHAPRAIDRQIRM